MTETEFQALSRAGHNRIPLHLETFADLHEIEQALRAAREVADRKAIRHAMSRTDNNISGAAKLLGISRPTLYDLLKQYRLSA